MACSGGADPAPTPEAPEPSASAADSREAAEALIVFAAPVGDHHEIFSLDLASGARTQLTSLSRSSEFPVWSPAGDRIAFIAMSEQSADLLTLDPASGEISTLIAGYANLADWGPNGESLLIAREDDDGEGGLFVLDVASSDEKRVETGSTADAYARWARAAPVIAYESGRDGNPEIYVTWLETGQTTRLTDNGHLDEWPSPSPDGSHIAWASGTEEDKNLWIMRSDGSDKRQVTRGLLFGDAFPEWSPEGDRIVLTVNENDEFVLKLVDLESGAVTDLGPGAAASWRWFG